MKMMELRAYNSFWRGVGTVILAMALCVIFWMAEAGGAMLPRDRANYSEGSLPTVVAKVTDEGEICCRGEIVMRDRHRLSQDGFIVALIPVNSRRQLVGEPQIISRGFVYLKDADALLKASSKEIKRQYKRGIPHLKQALEDFFYRETHSRPVVLPRFIEVAG